MYSSIDSRPSWQGARNGDLFLITLCGQSSFLVTLHCQQPFKISEVSTGPY